MYDSKLNYSKFFVTIEDVFFSQFFFIEKVDQKFRLYFVHFVILIFFKSCNNQNKYSFFLKKNKYSLKIITIKFNAMLIMQTEN